MISQNEYDLLIKTRYGRIEIINITHEIYEYEKKGGRRVKKKESQIENFQNNKTPMEIIEKMCDKTCLFDKKILVMFNLEFLEHLVFNCNVPIGNISFIADTELEKMICNKLYGCYSIVVPENKFKDNRFIKEIKVMGKKFDLCFSNPPYNSGVDLKIIREVEPICDEMVIVHPSTWLIDLKGKNKAFNDFKTQIDEQVKSIEMFNGNPVFNIGLFVPCVITHLDKAHTGKISVKHFENVYSVDGLEGVTKFGESWETIVKPFYEQIKEYVGKNGSVWDKKIETREEETGKFYVQLAGIRGNVDLTGDGSKIVKDDFYTMIMENPEANKGIRKEFSDKSGATNMPTFCFNNENEMENFINYLKTDFARFCLAILKMNQKLVAGEMELIPWLDFTEEWDDEKLFKHFNVNEETQQYIREFLPDFHGVRK